MNAIFAKPAVLPFFFLSKYVFLDLPLITINYFQVIVSKYPGRADYKVYWFSLGSSYAFILIHFPFARPENPKGNFFLSHSNTPPSPSPPSPATPALICEAWSE